MKCSRRRCKKQATHGVAIDIPVSGGDRMLTIFSTLECCHHHALDVDAKMFLREDVRLMITHQAYIIGGEPIFDKAHPRPVRLDSVEWAQWEKSQSKTQVQ